MLTNNDITGINDIRKRRGSDSWKTSPLGYFRPADIIYKNKQHTRHFSVIAKSAIKCDNITGSWSLLIFFSAQRNISLLLFHISQDFIGQITRM